LDTFSDIEKQSLQEYGIIAGVDESGRGPLAGPVVAAAVIFPPNAVIPGVRDSKLTKEQERRELSLAIKRTAVSWGIAEASVKEIDRINILEASRLAMKRAVKKLQPQPQLCLVDGWKLPQWEMPHYGIIKGDASCFTIAAASILAKEYRDELMKKLDGQFPVYGFAKHKGYPTPEHRMALEKYGYSPAHRLSFHLIASEIPVKRIRPRRLGVEAEEAAVNYLKRQGYQIVARNFRGGRCEIDIIAEYLGTLVFVEVKSSQTVIPPETEVNLKKVAHIVRAAEVFLMSYSIPFREIRFDIMALRFEDDLWKINHLIDAFRP